MKQQQTMAAVLVALFLVLALVVVLIQGATEKPTPAEQRIWDWTPGAVAALTARSAEGTSAMRKDTLGTWHLVEPPLGPADQNRLNWLVEDLAHLETVRRFAPGQVQPAEAGLDAPAFTLTIELRGGQEHMLEVGQLAPTGLYYYVRADGAIHLCPYDVIERAMRLVTIPPVATVPSLWPTEAVP